MPSTVFTESALGFLIAEDEPILWVRLNEGSDSEVYEQHFVGTGTVNGTPGRAGMGSGFVFDGVDDSVFFGCDQLTNVPPRLLNEAGGFTIELLLTSQYVDEDGASKVLRWGYNGVEIVAYKFGGEDDSGYLTCRFYDEDSTTYDVEHYDAELFTPGVQKHIAATYDGADLKLFIDGVMVESVEETAVPNWLFSNTSENGLGIATNGPFGGDFFKGTVGEVAIYDAALSDARVLEHAEATRTATSYGTAEVSAWGVPEGLPSASSFYLRWFGETGNPDDPTDLGLYTGASAKLTVPETPVMSEIYFWALQVYFYDAEGNQLAGAHTGLQWAPGHPNNRAVNWGGYSDVTESELDGTTSDMPSATDNPNTRDYEWDINTEYTFEISHVGDGFWRATVNGETIRDLEVPDSAFISTPILFSEIFAACDDPTHMVKWRDPYLYDADDNEYYFPEALREFQVIDACDNTDSYSIGGYFEMHTNVVRDEEASSNVNLRGPNRFEGLFPEWPAVGEVASELNWSVKISDFPYDSYRRPLVKTYHNIVDDAGDQLDGGFEVALIWDPTKAAFNTLRVNGYYFIPGETEEEDLYYEFSELGEAFVDVIDDTEEGYLYLEFPWTTDTTYDFQLKLEGANWALYESEVKLFEFPNFTDIAAVSLYSFEAEYQTYCGGLKMKAGIGNVTAFTDEEIALEEVFVDLDFANCSTDDAYVEDGFFTIENNTVRTVPPGGTTLSV